MRIGNFILFEKVTEDRDETLVQFDKEANKRKLMKPFKFIGEKAEQVVNWGVEHPVEAAGVVSLAVSGGYKLYRLIVRDKEVRHEKYIADCRFYDPRYGEYTFSKRKLTTSERNRLKDIYNSDRKMSYSQALTKMGLNKD